MVAIGGDAGAGLSKDGGIFDRRGGILQPQKMAVIVGDGRAIGGCVIHRFAHDHEAIRIAKGEGIEQNRIDDAEDRCDRADAQGERQDGREREAGDPAQLANSEANVREDFFEPRQATVDAVGLANLRDAAKCSAALRCGLVRPTCRCADFPRWRARYAHSIHRRGRRRASF